MSEFRFILNGEELNDHPDGWKDFTEAIVRDESIHGITLEYTSTLTFHGDGFQVLEAAYQKSYCAEMNLIVEQNCGGSNFQPILDLLLKVTDIDTNINQCTAEVKLTDNSYYGMIHNNKELSVPLIATLSKNGDPIAACPTISFKTFLPRLSSGKVDYMATNRTGYDHKDALSFVLRYITDGRITQVVSDYLDNLKFIPNAEYFDVTVTDAQTEQPMGFVLLSGYNVRIGGSGESVMDVRITLQTLLDTLYTKHGLFWAIEDGVFRIEPVSYFFDVVDPEESPLIADNQPDIQRSVKTERLYSAVDFGSSDDLPDRELIYAMPYVDLISHQQQRYNLSGVCNTDTVLDLVTGYPYDSNVIEKIIQTQIEATNPTEIDQSKDQDVIYIQYFQFTEGDGADNLYYAAFSSFFLRPDTPEEPTGIVYNPYLFNSEISKRHAVQSDYSLYVTDSDDNFRVSYEGAGNLYGNFHSDILIQVPFVSGNYAFNTQMFAAFGIGVPDLAAPGWGGFCNNDFDTVNYPVGIAPLPLKTPFIDDSSGNNFNPNGNWDVIDRVFTAPATGVYGFDVVAIINKRSDHVKQNNVWFETQSSQPYDRRLIRPRFFFSYVYAVYYDSSDNMISYEFITSTDNSSSQQFNFNTNRVVRNWPGFNPVYLNQPENLALSNLLNNLVWDYASMCTQSWPDSQSVQAPFITHMDAGQKMAIMVFTASSFHVDRIDTTQERQVNYGLMNGSSIRTTFFLTGGGEFDPVDVDANYATVYGFDRPTTIEDWLKMRENPKASIYVSPSAENLIRGYDSKIVRNFNNGHTDFELIGNRKQPNF